MLTAGGVCLGLVAGWVMAGAARAVLRRLAAVALWAAGGAMLLLLLPALPLAPLLAGIGTGLAARAILFGFAIKEGKDDDRSGRRDGLRARHRLVPLFPQPLPHQ